jgi:hypothetical protein
MSFIILYRDYKTIGFRDLVERPLNYSYKCRQKSRLPKLTKMMIYSRKKKKHPLISSLPLSHTSAAS